MVDCGFQVHQDHAFGSGRESYCSLAFNLGWGKPRKKCKPETCPIWQTYELARNVE